MAIRLTSSAFKHGATIPAEYTCDGKNISPPLQWENVPPSAQSFAITVDDPDAPSGIFVHWVIYNIPADATSLLANLPGTETLPNGAGQGYNGYGDIGYGGPCPPKDSQHHYYFKIYALDTMLDLQPGAMRRMLIASLDGHILDEGQLMGVYKRP